MNAVRSVCRQSWRALHVWHLDEPIGYLLGLLMQRALLGKPRALGLLEQATLRLCSFVPRDMVSADRIEAIKRIQRWRLGRPREPLPEEGSNVFLGPHPAKRYAHLVLHELAAKHASAFVRDVKPSLPEGSIERKRVEWRSSRLAARKRARLGASSSSLVQKEGDSGAIQAEESLTTP
jgi:hypothetical protein